jgi:hypothetical protein
MFGLSGIELIYWVSTIIGGMLFILRLILMLVGGIGEGEVDTDMVGDFDGDVDADFDGDVVDSDIGFKLLSMQGLTAFFMIFGLVGLALLKSNVAEILTVLGGGAAGLITVLVISVIFSQMRHLQSSGTLNLNNAVGKSGMVYTNIPEKGTGQVRVSVQGSLKIFDAGSNDGSAIKTGEIINVIEVIDNKTLIVERK